MSTTLSRNEIVNLSIEIMIKAVGVGLVLFYAFSILKPFIIPVLWGVIIAVALAPFITKMEKTFSGKRTMIVVTITTLAIAVLVIPTYMLSDSVIESSQKLSQDFHAGTLTIPAPSESVKSWPLVGEKIHGLWSGAATDLSATLVEYKPQLTQYVGTLASSVGHMLGGVLQFVVSLIIAAIFLSKTEGSVKAYQAISHRLMGEKGVEWANLSALTIRSVVQGVIGIALIQSTLSLIGFAFIDLPLAWLWAFAVMFVAIIQVPTILVLGPIIAYVFSSADATTATIFAVYTILVGLSDNILKPLLLGRGVDIPMLVILLGAIGGMILSGILGLFVGAVGLALAYKLFITWLDESVDEVAVSTQKA